MGLLVNEALEKGAEKSFSRRPTEYGWRNWCTPAEKNGDGLQELFGHL